jgi:hypothetical protein
MAKHLGGYKLETTKKKRTGIHSKCKTSSHKGSKHYKKTYRGQGR